MGQILRKTGLLVLVSISIWACDGAESDPAGLPNDCRAAGRACGVGFVCQPNEFGAYECRASTNADGGIRGAVDAGDIGRSDASMNACAGHADGHILAMAEYAACTFADACVETGEQTRSQSVCRDGVAVDELDTQACERDTDGMRLTQPEFNRCTFEDDCIETGEQMRTHSVCRDGIAVDELETQACERDTDGTIVGHTEFNTCFFTDDCIETGEQTRTNMVCRDGVTVEELETQACVRDTDGTIVRQAAFGECVGFDNLCDLTGEQSRINGVCRQGIANDERETQACERDDPGITVTDDRVAVCMTDAGGTLELPGARFTVPAGALGQSAELYLERAAEPPPAIAGLSVLSPIFNTGPVGTQLLLPATVSTRFDGDLHRAALFVEHDRNFRRLGGRILADEVEGEVEQLGAFLVADGVDFRLNVDRECGVLRTLDGRVQAPGTVALFFTVDDCDGRPLTGLEHSDFEILEGEIRLNDEHVRRILPGDGVQTFVSLVIDLSNAHRNHLDELIAGSSSFVRMLKDDRNLAVQIGIEVFAGDQYLTRWQASNLDADTLLERLAALGEFVPDVDDSTNLNGAIIQGLQRLAADTQDFRTRNRGGAFTTEHLIVFTASEDTAGLNDADAVRESILASSASVTMIGLDSPGLDVDALHSLSDDLIMAPGPASLRREFQTVAARIARQMERAYLLAYCTPQQAGDHTVTVRLSNAENRGTARFSFTADAIAAPGCREALLGDHCANKQCGGLGCGFCDDRRAGCNLSDQCQSFCDTDPVTITVAVADRCDFPNPQGYVQFCEQDISTRCDETCTDIANDPENCGGCAFDCGPNVVGVVDGERTVGHSCQNRICQCALGWYGEACDQSRCGDGFLTPDEACDDGNVDGDDGCSVNCLVEDLWVCDRNSPSQCDGIRGDAQVRGTEACDDGVDMVTGQAADGDGCSAMGVVELGYTCDGEPSVCVSECGDGLVVGDEWCDDGNADNADGCTDSCEAGWTQVASLPPEFSQTHHSFAFSIDGLGYIISGSSSAGVRDDFYQYDPVDDEWTELESFPGSARGFAIGDTWDGKAYFGFGRDDQGYLNDLWVFDPEDMSWTELAPCPCSARAHPAMIAHNDKIFVGLGNGSNGNTNDWWEYDIVSNTWSEKDDFPSSPRHHPYQFGIGEYVYTGFGHGNGIFNNWFSYDIVEELWTEVASLPAEGRVAGTQFSYDGIGYVLSGDGEDHRSMETGEFWAYDPIDNAWEEGPPHPGGSRWAPASFIIHGHVYLINGTSFRRYISENYKYDLTAFPQRE